MPGKKKTAGKFKSKGSNILKGQGAILGSMEDFLKDTQKHKSMNTQSHENTNLERNNSTNGHLLQGANDQILRTSKDQEEELGRLHIQIRQDLFVKLLDAVFKRKRDSNIRMRNATQRAIIEEALEKYFM